MTTTSKKTTKLFIPHIYDSSCSITGVLEQVDPDAPTQGRKIALILHGTMGHKDYLFQKRLALRLPIDSFRFDFRGNHETGGKWRMSALNEDVQDIEVVVAYLMNLGYVIDLIVGHSRGVVAGLRWMCTSEAAKTVRGFVNASGRYRMRRIHDNIPAKNKEELGTQGYYESKATVARKPFVGIVTAADLEEFSTFDTTLVWDRFPARTDVLTVHGLADRVVPPYDAVIYARALGARSPGTHSLCYVEDADHNFTGRSDDVVAIILEWWGKAERQELKTGVWNTGVRVKL